MVIYGPDTRVHALTSAAPLSWDLRDFPVTKNGGGLPLRWKPFHRPRFPEVHHPIAVLLPESFRGGCSFGPLLRQSFGGRLPRGIVCWPTPRRRPADRDV